MQREQEQGEGRLVRSQRELEKWEQIAAECVQAWKERKPGVVDYAIMRIFGMFT